MTPHIDKKLELEDIDVILSFESTIGLLVYYLKQDIRINFIVALLNLYWK